MSEGSSENKEQHQILRIDEVAKWLRIPNSTLYKLCNDGKIPAAKIGRHWRFDRAVIDQWFHDNISGNVAQEELSGSLDTVVDPKAPKPEKSEGQS